MRIKITILSLFSLLAQLSLGQFIKKEKIYTLSSSEVVAYEENSLDIHQDELGYIVVTADIKEFTRNYHINDKIYGPFDRRIVEKPFFNLDTWGFIDSKQETSYVLFNGKEIGVHNMPEYPVGLKVAGNTWAYVLIDQVVGTSKVIINGKEQGPYPALYNYHISENGKEWAISYSTEPEEYYVEFSDGKKLGPYKELIDFQFLTGRGNDWVLMAVEQGTLPKEVDSRKIEVFSVVAAKGKVGDFEKEKADNPSFDFKNLETNGANYGINVVQNQQYYYLANDEIYGPYKSPVTSIDLGEKLNQFNYIVKETQNLHFRGDGIFAKNVEKFFVSDSRKSVAVIKKAGGGKSELSINDKDDKRVFNKIEYVKFAPKSEDWAALTNEGGGNYRFYLKDGRQFGPYKIDTTEGLPTILLGKGAKNWAFAYLEAGTGEQKLILNNETRKEEFIGNIAITIESGKEYFSWFSLEERTVYLNKLLLE